MDLTLYRVGASGRVKLDDLADGVEFYTAEKADDTGIVTLTPVRVVSATGRRVNVNDAIDATHDEDVSSVV